VTRVAIDTDVLAYAEGLLSSALDEPKIQTARGLLREAIRGRGPPIVPVQALAELHRLLLCKGGLAMDDVARRISRLRGAVDVIATTPAVFDLAQILSRDHGLQIFDGIILGAAVSAQCDLLVSEDLHDGFAWRGTVVTNPFGAAPDRRLGALLKGWP
jgi:predicted nucleic acid-binding protein